MKASTGYVGAAQVTAQVEGIGTRGGPPARGEMRGRQRERGRREKAMSEVNMAEERAVAMINSSGVGRRMWVRGVLAGRTIWRVDRLIEDRTGADGARLEK